MWYSSGKDTDIALWILLTTTALVAFAGAAAADGHTSVSHALSAELGYNNEADAIGEDGFFWEGNLKTTATAALDNGLTAGAYFEITVSGDDAAAGSSDAGNALVASDFVLSLTSETASLYFGDTAPAGKKYFSAAGDMEAMASPLTPIPQCFVATYPSAA